jgi:hypothetical protein
MAGELSNSNTCDRAWGVQYTKSLARESEAKERKGVSEAQEIHIYRKQHVIKSRAEPTLLWCRNNASRAYVCF